jgi:hypothetical protein
VQQERVGSGRPADIPGANEENGGLGHRNESRLKGCSTGSLWPEAKSQQRGDNDPAGIAGQAQKG